jgi:hypothetical protein
MVVDTSFDFRDDARGKDPDAHSPILRQYHRFLWSKPLPCGPSFDLSDTERRHYLYHDSELGQFSLSSDSVIPTYTRLLRGITELFPEEEIREFESKSYTIGGMMIFPGNRIDGKCTINVARGLNKKMPLVGAKRLTCGTSAIFSEGEISLQKQSTSWRSKWDSNSRAGQENCL